MLGTERAATALEVVVRTWTMIGDINLRHNRVSADMMAPWMMMSMSGLEGGMPSTCSFALHVSFLFETPIELPVYCFYEQAADKKHLLEPLLVHGFPAIIWFRVILNLSDTAKASERSSSALTGCLGNGRRRWPWVSGSRNEGWEVETRNPGG